MAYVRYFPTFHQLEPTLLPEESGFVVSQVKVDLQNITKKSVSGVNFIENGILCTFDTKGEIVDYSAGKPLFIHWDEELNTVLPGNRYFAVEVEDTEVYIRLIRLVPGAEWTTTIAPNDAVYAAAISEGKIVKVEDTTMADGTVAYAYRCIA